jgi:hypothetical protein
MKKTVLFVSAVILVIAFVYLGIFGGMTTAKKFSFTSFGKLRPGDSFQTVIDTLGLPVNYTVVAPPNAAGTYYPICMTNMESLSAFAQTTNNFMVILQYSRPRWGDYYYQFEVIVRSNAVLQTRHYYSTGS